MIEDDPAIVRLRERSQSGEAERDLAILEELERKKNKTTSEPSTPEPPPIAPELVPLLAELAQVGGADDTRPPLEVLEELDQRAAAIARVVGGWRSEDRRKALMADIARLQEASLTRHEDLGKLRERIAEARKMLGAVDERRVASLGERLLARLQRSALVHVPTSLPTLDAATRGGLLQRRVHVIGGEPDSGKTALLVQMLLHAARDGYAVAIYAVDEPGEGIEDRIGQSMGLALDDLEANVEKAILWLAEAVRDLPNVLLIEQDEDGFATIEDAADALLAHAKRHGCRGAVLGIDSLQTARCRAHLGPTAPRTDRDRIEAMTGALKATAKRGLEVVVTSELGRASYAARQGQKPPSPMAAFKGSGSIEYCMTVGILLTRITRGDHAGDMLVRLPKNKRGEPSSRGIGIRLERDPDRCTYTDRGRIDASDQADEAPKGESKTSETVSEKLLERIRHELRKRPKGIAGGAEGLASLVEGHRPKVRGAIKRLEATGEIERRGGKMFHRDQAAPADDVTAEALRGRVVAFIEAETVASRPVPSRRAVVVGLKDRGQGARRGDVYDAIEVLVAVGQVRESDAGTLSLLARG